MLYLLANIVFASMFTLCIKWVQVRQREDIVTIGAINYIVAAALIAPEFLNGPRSLSLHSNVFTDDVLIWAVITGGSMGVSYFIAYFFIVYAIRFVGAANSTVIAVLSLIVPIAFGVFLWNEQPNSHQVVGVALALFALILIGSGKASLKSTGVNLRAEFAASPTASPWIVPFVLVTFFVLCGTSRLAQEAFKYLSDPSERPTYLFSAFLAAAVPSMLLLFVRGRKVTPVESGFGVVMGAANILQTHFILKSLQHYDGFIVFPVVSAGSLMLTTMVATQVLGEQIGARSRVGIATAVAALFLLNHSP